MQASLGVSSNVDIPGVDRLRRRRSPTFEGQVDGGVSPLLGLRRESRTDFSIPFSYDSTQQDLSEGSLELRRPSDSGSTSIEINRVRRNTPEMTLSGVCLTDHDPERVALTPSDGSHLFGSIRNSDSIGSFDEADEASLSLNSRPRSCSLDNIWLADGCNTSRTKSQLDSTIPLSGPQAVDLNKHISENEITDETSLKETRCSNGVEIFGSPPTVLCGIGLQGQHEVCRSPSVCKKPDIKSSICLAGFFTGVAVVVGTIFSRTNKEY